MNWIDWIVLATFAFYIFEGIRRGFIEQTLEFVFLALTIILSIILYQQVGLIIADKIGIAETVASPVGFFACWFIIQLVFALILRIFYPLIPSALRHALPNRLLGIIPALLKAAISVAIVLMIVVVLPIPARFKESVNQSIIGRQFMMRSSLIEAQISRLFHGDFDNVLTFLTVPAQNEQIIEPGRSIELGYRLDSPSLDETAEKKLLDLVNKERSANNLPLLVWDDRLAAVARAHSLDMFKQGYFSHTAADGKSPFERISTAGITYEAAGENIALAPTVDLAHSGLMRSPGHRANILDKDFGRIGIGVYNGGIYGMMFTQVFKD